MYGSDSMQSSTQSQGSLQQISETGGPMSFQPMDTKRRSSTQGSGMKKAPQVGPFRAPEGGFHHISNWDFGIHPL